MAEIIEESPLELDVNQAISRVSRPENPINEASILEPEEPDALETAAAFWRRETVIGSLMNYGIDVSDEDLKTVDPSWNPYAYYQEHQEDYKDIEKYVRQGYFDNILNEGMFLQQVQNLRNQQKDLAIISTGSMAGQFLGMGLSLADLTTLIPVAGPLQKGKAAFNMARVAGAAAGATALQEGLLQQNQELRTAKESLMNIGTATVLGGGLGGFAVYLNKKHVGHPKHPDNPLRLENLDKQPMAAVPVGKPLSEAEELSVGAAQVTNTGAKKLRPEPTGAIGKAAQKVSDFFTGWTPVARAVRWPVDTGRRIMQDLIDTSSIHTDHQAAGKATGASVEEMIKDLMTPHEFEFNAITGAHFQLNNDLLGKQRSSLTQELASDLSRASRGKVQLNPLEFHEFANDVVRKRLIDGYWTPEDTRWLEDLLESRGYDRSHATTVISKADEVAELLHTHNQQLEDIAVASGVMPEDKRMGRSYAYQQAYNTRAIEDNYEVMREEMIKYFLKEPDETFLEELGMNLDEFRKLDPNDPKRAELLAEWHGDKTHTDLLLAEQAARRAQEEYDFAKSVLKETLRGTRTEGKELAKASLSELRKKAQFFEANLQTEREKLLALQAEEKAIINAAEAARTQTLARDLEFTTDGLVSNRRQAPETADTIRQAERARTIALELQRQTTKVGKMEKRLGKIKEALEVAQAQRARIEENLKVIKQVAKSAGVELKDSEKSLKAALRELKKAIKRRPIEAKVDDLITKMIAGDHFPMGIVDELNVGESGRVKSRRFRWSPEARRRLEQTGILRTDLMGLRQSTYQDLAPRIAFREKFGTDDPREVLKELKDAYQTEYERLKASGASESQLAQLRAAQEKNELDFVEMWKKLSGRHQAPTDPTNFATWGAGKIRQWTYNRFAAGFTVSALGDPVNMAIQQGFKNITPKAFKQAHKLVSQLRTGGKHQELANLLIGLERVMAFSRFGKQMSVEDLADWQGFGTPGTFTHKFTSGFDRFSNAVQEKVHVFSGQAYWTSLNKALAGIIQIENLAELLPKFDSLPEVDKVRMASLGIDKHMAARISKLIDKYAVRAEDGLLDLNANLWVKESGGLEAKKTLEYALRRAAKRAVLEPGAGDTPLFMSTPMGKLLLQFGAIGFSAVNHILTPSAQRLMNYQDFRTVLGYTFLFFAGTMITAAKSAMRGEDPTKMTHADIVKEAIDRSGLLAYMGPYVDASLKMFGGHLNQMTGTEVFSPTSKYRQNNALMSLMGPWLGTIKAGSDTVTALSQGEFDQAGKKAAALAPFNQFFKMQQVIVNQ